MGKFFEQISEDEEINLSARDLVFYEEWPSVDLRNTVLERLPKEKSLEAKPLEKGAYDVTRSYRAIELVEKYKPTIYLEGLELRSEKKSRNWGGILYRVVADTADLQTANRATLQFIYVWTKQQWFISFWMTILPLLMLFFLSAWISTDLLFYNTDVFGENPSDISESLIFLPSFLRLSDRIFIILLISILFIIVGIRYSISYRQFVFHNLTLFIFFGLLFALQIAEIMFDIVPPFIIVLNYQLTYVIPYLNFSQDNLVDLSIRFPFISFIFLILAIIFLFIYLFQPKIPFIESKHEMDYAPVFVYLKRDATGEWTLDYIIYDKIHYYTGILTAEELQKQKLLYKATSPILVINNTWHSFAPERPKWIRWSFAFVIFLISMGIFLFSIFSPINYLIFLKQMLGEFFAEIISRVVIPLTIFGSGLYFIIHWPTKLYEKENLLEERYHLSQVKLSALWSLEPKEAQLKIKKKLQDPFNTDKDFWKTFRD